MMVIYSISSVTTPWTVSLTPMLMSPKVALQARQRAVLPVAYWAVPIGFTYSGDFCHS